MTCIAFDGKTLAADKQSNYQGLRRTTTKIHRVDWLLFGASGDSAQCREMLAWVRGGRKFEDFPASQRGDDWASVLVISKSEGILLYEKTPHPILIEDKTIAIGSGRDYALAAMHLGRSAREAVEVACHFETGCGMGIDVLELGP